MDVPLTSNDILSMRKAGAVAGLALRRLKGFIRKGISTKDIECFFDKILLEYPDMTAAFKGYQGYPGSACVSVNEEVIHGIPLKEKIIQDGDLVSVDLGIQYQDVFVDTARTYAVGRITPQAKKLTRVTEKALYLGIKTARIGATVGDISAVIQEYVESNGFSVIRKFIGHGIGKQLHMPPEVPNFGEHGTREKLFENMAIAIEPMVAVGHYDVDTGSDGWTITTKDKSLTAHFEHTIVITKRGPYIVTM